MLLFLLLVDGRFCFVFFVGVLIGLIVMGRYAIAVVRVGLVVEIPRFGYRCSDVV